MTEAQRDHIINRLKIVEFNISAYKDLLNDATQIHNDDNVNYFREKLRALSSERSAICFVLETFGYEVTHDEKTGEIKIEIFSDCLLTYNLIHSIISM